MDHPLVETLECLLSRRGIGENRRATYGIQNWVECLERCSALGQDQKRGRLSAETRDLEITRVLPDVGIGEGAGGVGLIEASAR